MSLIAIIVLFVVLAVVWRLVRLAVRLVLLFATLAAVVIYACAHSASDSTNDLPAAQNGRVARVADGDTLTVLSGHDRVRVRMLGIDAPESSSTRYGRPDCGGQAAKASLRRLARRATRVRVRTDPASGDVRDRYGRRLGYVETRRGRDLGEAQLEAGMAVVYRYRDRAFSRLARYQQAQAQARDAKRGVWQACHGRFHAPRR